MTTTLTIHLAGLGHKLMTTKLTIHMTLMTTTLTIHMTLMTSTLTIHMAGPAHSQSI